MTNALNKCMNYLLNNLKAYKGLPHTKGLCNSVKTHLFQWGKQQEEMTMIRLPVLREVLYDQSCSIKKDLSLLNKNWHHVQLLPTDDKYL